MISLLLISFAVAIGVVIMNFGRAQVESEAECPINIGLKLSVISGNEEICYNSEQKELSFAVENGINIDVVGLVVNVIGTQKAETSELNEAKMGKAGVYMGKVKYDQSAGGDIRQVKISPKVILYDNEEVCAEKALVVEKVRAC